MRRIRSEAKLEDVSRLAAASHQKPNIRGTKIGDGGGQHDEGGLGMLVQRDGCANVIFITQRREVGMASHPHWWPVNLENVAKSLDPMQTKGTNTRPHTQLADIKP